MRAWIFQDYRQKQKLGDKCPWSVGWIDASGKRRSKRVGCKSLASKSAKRLENEAVRDMLNPGCQPRRLRDVVDEWKKWAVGRMRPGTLRDGITSLNHFCRILGNPFVNDITTRDIDRYAQQRAHDDGKHGGKVLASTINKDLRRVKAMLRLAEDWGYVSVVPKIRPLRQDVRMPRFMPQEDFATIFKACEKFAAKPHLPYCTPAEWWRALLAFAYMTGWRIGEILSLRKEDVNLTLRTVVTRADDNKGRRDELTPLHPAVVPLLEKVMGSKSLVFQWPHHERTLWTDFARLQKHAGISLACDKQHRHGLGCHTYGFHDMRRAFATNNANNLSATALQSLMRHKAYETTRKYINVAKALHGAADNLYCPDILGKSIECLSSVAPDREAQPA